MTRSQFRLVIGAISLLGLAGWSWPGPPPGGEGAEAPGATAAAAAGCPGPEAKAPQIVLLGDGRLVPGVVSEEDGMVVVTQPIGAMRFPKRRVERVFGSMQEVYRYKLDELPEKDVDERLKLARWCLAQKMETEAREQLAAILAISPKNAQAKAMVVSLDQAEARGTLRRDPDVQQAAAEGPRVDAAQPATLDASVISSARRRMGVNDLPVIFDLPPAQAVKRADEFARYVHPVLQTHCAKCHNESYDGPFQLVPFKTKADRTPDALRTNLDATLRLVDRDNPSRSELLSSTLRPHGRSQNPRPIFRGSNDQAYRILAAWAAKLKANRRDDGAAQAGLPRNAPAPAAGTGAGEPGDAFASDRSRVGREPAGTVPPVQPFVTGPVETKTLPPTRYVPGAGMVAEKSVDPAEFPMPFAVTGKKPALPTDPKPPGAAPTLPPTAPRATPRAGSPSAAPPAPAAKDPAMTRPATADDAADDEPAAEQKPRKPLRLDPSILQRALQLKNQGRPAP